LQIIHVRTSGAHEESPKAQRERAGFFARQKLTDRFARRPAPLCLLKVCKIDYLEAGNFFGLLGTNRGSN
jgi:hypothetical protein